MWCIPPKQSAEFVFHMEDVLEVYHRPYDPKRPVLCIDETFKQLIGETRKPLPLRPGMVERYDHEYVRNGVASLFLACEPLAGWRHVAVTEHRGRVDWAGFIRSLLDGRYAQAERVVLVMDQLNTHALASLYETFPPDDAKRLAERIELHHTPKHGSSALRSMAEHRRDRAECSRTSMLGAAHRSPRQLTAQGRAMGATAQRGCHQGRLAVHDRPGPRQVAIPLPITSCLTLH
jgi:hypothetical protein